MSVAFLKEEYGHPTVGILRAKRHAILMGALGAVPVHMSRKCVVRQQMLGDGPPQYRHYCTYRGTTSSASGSVTGVTQWLGRGRRFGGVPANGPLIRSGI